MVTARRLLTMRAYRQTPDGKAAAKRSHDNYTSKRHDNKTIKLTFESLDVSGLLSTWTTK